mmetsp:Transcript_69507/g.184485  ORF Transcript_69507/g.184485 Transcript_69507/m.184485 type:complete len:229 (-) Transcript_69507:790-1476(-)
MASPNFLMSSWAAAMPSWALAMAVSASEMSRSNPFFLSSASSNCLPQYSFLLSSSTCSRFRVATIPSIIAITFSKPIFLPLSAYSMNAIMELPPLALVAACSKMALARDRTVAALMRISRKLALLDGNVFLNSSSASSSLSSLMVSARANSSCWRTLQRASHSAVFVLQPVSSSARNFLSSARDSVVSPRSFFISAIITPSSPFFWSLSSIILVRALISSVLAATSSS